MDQDLDVLVLTPPGFCDSSVAIAAARAGACGVLDLEFSKNAEAALSELERLERFAKNPYGIKISACCASLVQRLIDDLPPGLTRVLMAGGDHPRLQEWVQAFRSHGIEVLWEATSLDEAIRGQSFGVTGTILKGNEAGGRVGQETAFVLLQRWQRHVSTDPDAALPVWVQGGIGPNTAASCALAGAAGVVIDSQVLLTRESPLPEQLRQSMAGCDGSETVCLGGRLGENYRVYKRHGSAAVAELEEEEQRLCDAPESDKRDRWRKAVERLAGSDPAAELCLLGQDVALAKSLADRYVTVGGIIGAIREGVVRNLETARRLAPLAPEAPLAQSHGTRYPIVQGPMGRVSDTATFAKAVAEAGALPFLSLGLSRRDELGSLLDATSKLVGQKPWGVGLLGFIPSEILDEQMKVVREKQPPYALIAGGRPQQAKQLEDAGIPTYLHVPSPGLLEMFLREGAGRFILEGRECGGHVGPRSSFLLWESMCDILLQHLGPSGRGEHIHLLFAGGIHDSLSAAMVSALAAPLVERGVKIGVQMGTAYLFTEEAVTSGAIVPGFQKEALACDNTVVLETAPGHAIRCVDTPFCGAFEAEKRRLLDKGCSREEVTRRLELMNLGRLRVASKGLDRPVQGGMNSSLVQVPDDEQHQQGVYMIGQVAGLRDQVTTVARLHKDVSEGSEKRLEACVPAIGEETDKGQPCDIAIIGMACHYPGATNLLTYWENILNRVDAVTEVPPTHWDWRLYYDPDPQAPDRIISKWGGFVGDIPFDPLRYGITPNSMKAIEPLQLLLLEAVRFALDDAGYTSRPFNRQRTAAVLGIGGSGTPKAVSYGFRACIPLLDAVPNLSITSAQIMNMVKDYLPEWTEDSFPGFLMNVAAGRVANRFNFGGTNMAVDAACASSLASLNVCVRELQMGTADMAVAMGADTIQTPYAYTAFSKTHALSPTGRCRPFDANADGFVMAEGVGVVVLKRLADAERDGDTIYAVIKGIGTSSDGNSKGITAPNADGQLLALRRAYHEADLSPARLGLIEAHGTGTMVGDPTEVQSLKDLLGPAEAERQSCALGSVKSMIGHPKCAAGIAGMIKAVLALHHKVLPPTIVENPDPKIGWEQSPLYLNTDRRPWVHGAEYPRTAGVSAFGFGGTNLHVVLEEYNSDYLEEPSSVLDHWPAELMVWRRKSRAELTTAVEHCHTALVDGAQPEMADLSASVWKSNPADRSLPTLAVVATSVDDLKEKLPHVIKRLQSSDEHWHDPRGLYFAEQPTADGGKVAFLFPGQGSQYPDMLSEVAMVFPEVRDTLDRAEKILSRQLDRPLGRFIYPPSFFDSQAEEENKRQLARTEVAQPALGAVSIGMLRLLKGLGIDSDFIAGHSYGEYVALCAAGVLNEEDLIRLSHIRGRLILEATESAPGAMAAVEADAETVAKAITTLPDVTLANLNSPKQTVISGTEDDIQAALELLAQRKVRARRLPVACAFHSPCVTSACGPLAQAIGACSLSSPKQPVFSNTTGSAHSDDPQQIAAVMADHLKSPVYFQTEIEAMYSAGARTFVEVGPGRVLTGLVQQILGDRPHRAVASDSKGASGLIQLQHLLAQLLVSGQPVKVERLFHGRNVQTFELTRLKEQTGEVEYTPTTWLVNGVRNRPVNGPEPLLIGQSHEVQERKPENAAHQGRVNSKPVSSSQTQPRQEHREMRSNTNKSNTKAAPSSNRNGRQDKPALRSPSGDRYVGTSAHAGGNGDVSGNGHPIGSSPVYGNGHASGSGQVEAPSPSRTVADSDEATEVMLRFQQLVSQIVASQRDVMMTYLQASGEEAPVSLPSGEMPDVLADRLQPPSFDITQESRFAVEGTLPDGESMAISAGRAETEPLASSPHGSQATEPADESEGPAPLNLDELTRQLLDLVSQRTGYPQEMLDLDLDLEANLGIDSIKRVEILGALAQSIGLSGEDGLESNVELEKLTGIRTLRGIIEYLDQALCTHDSAASSEAGQASATESETTQLNLEALQTELLDLVSQRTGYPQEMLDLDLDLEANLGIDSIKRVEILGALAQSIGLGSEDGLESNVELEKLTGIRTLRGILDYLEEALCSTEPEEAELSTETADSPRESRPVEIQRGLVELVDTPLPTGTSPLIPEGTVLLTDDGRGIAAELAAQLADLGQRAVLLRMGKKLRGNAEDGTYCADLCDPQAVEGLVSLVRDEVGAVAGLIHALPLGEAQVDETPTQRAHRDVKSLYLLARAFESDLRRAGNEGGAFLLAPTALGGGLGFSQPLPESFFVGHGGIIGFVKCLGREWPEVLVRAVDLDTTRPTNDLLDCLVAELGDREGPLEVGYVDSRRVTWKPVAMPLETDREAGTAIDNASTILVTGGARGITAEIACELARRYQPNLILVGRSELPQESESSDTALLDSPGEIKASMIDRARRDGRQPKPAEIETAYQRLLRDREIRGTLQRIRQAGARVHYYSVDVRDEAAMAQLIEKVEGQYGSIDGVIHGAGVIDDKLVKDKTPESFDLVFSTKVDSAMILSRVLQPQNLKFCVFFASIASRYGNVGQADYAAANEVLSKLAADLDRRWPTRVVSVAWGPWSGVGMVSDLEKHLAGRGVALIPPEIGTSFLIDELNHGPKGDSEVLIAGGAEKVAQPNRTGAEKELVAV